MATFSYVRVIRTPSSERYLISDSIGKEIGALELHFLATDEAAGSVWLTGKATEITFEIEELLRHIDETLLPGVAVSEGTLSFTVVRGEVVGTFTGQRST